MPVILNLIQFTFYIQIKIWFLTKKKSTDVFSLPPKTPILCLFFHSATVFVMGHIHLKKNAKKTFFKQSFASRQERKLLRGKQFGVLSVFHKCLRRILSDIYCAKYCHSLSYVYGTVTRK